MAANKMKAIKVSKLGSPEVMTLEEMDRPVPKPGQVLVKIKAAGVNPVDVYVREGHFGSYTLPMGMGGDAAGVIAEVPAGESRFKVGDRVFTCEGADPLTGAYAEYALVPVRNVFPLPDVLSFSQGAALGIPYLTALRCLMIKANAKPNETVLVHGASGAVGLAACQIASAWKMQVFGTAGTEEGLKLIRDNGAATVFDHHDKNHKKNLMDATGGKGFDVILEMLANENLGTDIEVVAEFGRIVIIGSRGEAKCSPVYMMGKEAMCVGVLLMKSTDEEWKRIGDELVKGINEGWVRPIIDQEFPLNQAAEAHKAVMQHTGGSKGKIVLIP
ncbi:quinone oxidoreductase-like [Paramacrobiotus metropolitanus]|uniref:quinone oxidoreductase-like n=1 Tax=Paramacrobiotus metropolitanus TaxID=2943436 RepID=UPI00244591DA|nr:quinone oxidoreductase-like [Paramacrobiotus metropolitanus]